MATGDLEYDWPFERLDISQGTRDALERIWATLSCRRPFKWDFPDMYSKDPAEWDEMTQEWADAIDEASDPHLKAEIRLLKHQVDDARYALKLIRVEMGNSMGQCVTIKWVESQDWWFRDLFHKGYEKSYEAETSETDGKRGT